MSSKDARKNPPARVPVVRFEKGRVAAEPVTDLEPLPLGAALSEETTLPGRLGARRNGHPRAPRGAQPAEPPRVIVNGLPYEPPAPGTPLRITLAPQDAGRGSPRRKEAKRGEEALEYHRRRLQGRPPSLSTAAECQQAELAMFGYSLFGRGCLAEAQVVFEGLVAGEPRVGYPYTMLGALFLAQGDDAKALALFDAALALDRTDLAARVSRGEIRLRRGQYKQAIHDLEKAIAADPQCREPFGRRARGMLALAKSLKDG